MSSGRVKTKLDTLPPSPGVYVFRDEAGAVLYVGKARNLRSRVRSYFQPGSSDVRAFVARLESELADLETFVVANEKEAALLENQLIKEYRPRYNVKLRDDKEYLSLRLDPNQEWPRLEVVRRPSPDQSLYFGPYHSATAARQTLRLVNRHFQLRTCTDSDFRSRTRPCLQYQIRRCQGPCVFHVDHEKYDEQVSSVALFLDGRHDELIDNLQRRMQAASDQQEYELASICRDQLRAVSRVREQQRVTSVKSLDQDVIGLFRQADQAEIAVLPIRGGKLVDVRTFALRDIALPNAELLASFVTEYYASAAFVPDEVLLSMPVEAMVGIAEMLSERRSRKCRVLAPQRGKRAELVRMAIENATHSFQEKQRASENIEQRLAQIQDKLRLPTLPRRIECVDISHSQGQDTVAAIVTLLDGSLRRDLVKHFHVRTTAGGDDYAAMHEALSRRFTRGRKREVGWTLPDLLVVDGGRGQRNVAQAALEALELGGIPVVGLAKERTTTLGEEMVDRVYLANQKNPIPVHATAALTLLSLARDEAHRASNALRTKTGKRRQLRSQLDDVPGIGEKTRQRLLKTFGSLTRVREASDEQLRQAGATRRQVEMIRTHLPAPAIGRSSEEPPPASAVDSAQEEERAIDNAFHST